MVLKLLWYSGVFHYISAHILIINVQQVTALLSSFVRCISHPHNGKENERNERKKEERTISSSILLLACVCVFVRMHLLFLSLRFTFSSMMVKKMIYRMLLPKHQSFVLEHESLSWSLFEINISPRRHFCFASNMTKNTLDHREIHHEKKIS